jgi:hypothetical protein
VSGNANRTLIATTEIGDIDSPAWLADVLRGLANDPATRLY